MTREVEARNITKSWCIIGSADNLIVRKKKVFKLYIYKIIFLCFLKFFSWEKNLRWILPPFLKIETNFSSNFLWKHYFCNRFDRTEEVSVKVLKNIEWTWMKKEWMFWNTVNQRYLMYSQPHAKWVRTAGPKTLRFLS